MAVMPTPRLLLWAFALDTFKDLKMKAPCVGDGSVLSPPSPYSKPLHLLLHEDLEAADEGEETLMLSWLGQSNGGRQRTQHFYLKGLLLCHQLSG